MTPHPFTKVLIRIAVAACFLMALAWLFSRAFIPSGRLVIVDDFIRAAPYLSEPKPSERLGESFTADDGSSRVPLTGSPLFVDLKPPAGFKEATLTLEYENAGQPVVELGALVSAIDQQFAMRPVENRVIDALPWKKISSGSVTLFQQGDRYASVDEFFRDPPSVSEVATYRAQADLPFRLEGYEPAAGGEPRTVTVSIRGHARILTYVKDEPLSFSFSVQDMNRLSGADPVTVSVYRGDAAEGDQPISRTVLPDDGNFLDNQKSSGLRVVPVTVTAPDEGFYKVEFTATADIFIRSIDTRQRKMVFQDDLYLGDHVGYSPKTDPITVYTDGGRLALRTPHAEAVQDVAMGGDKVRVDQPNVRYEHQVRGSGLTAVTVPKRDMLLLTTGLFALSEDAYFNPQPYRLEWYSTPQSLEDRGIHYVLSSYEPPEAGAGNVKSSRHVFDLSKLARTETGAYRFVIEAPGIEETRYDLLMKSLTVTLRRDPMTLTTLVPGIFDAFRPEAPRDTGVVTDGRTYGEMPE